MAADPAFRRIWMTALMVAVLLFSLMYLTYDLTKVATIIGMGDMWSFVDLEADRPGVFVEIDPEDYVAGPVPQVGDTLLTVAGLPATEGNYFKVFTTDTPAGVRVPIRFRHEGQVFTTEIVTRSIPGILKAQYVTLYALRFLLTLCLILVGFWAFTHRGESIAVRTLALFCYSMAVGMLLSVTAAPDPYARFHIPFADQILPLARMYGELAAPFWVKLQLLFPFPRAWYMKRKRLVDVLLFAPAIALPALALLGVKLPGAILPAVGFTYLLGGYFLLAVRYTQAQDLLSRRQIRLVLLGASPILLVTLVILVIAILDLTLSHLALLYLLNASCLAILAAPVTFAYAFGRYRLLDVEGRLRRGTRFAMINALLLLIFTGILYAFGTLLLKYLAIESRTPTLALGFVLALSFVPAQRGLRGLLERRFYPERLRLRALLQEFLESSGRTLDPSRFWQELTGRLSFGLRAEPVHAYLRTRQGIFTEAEGIAGGCAEPPSSIWDKLHGLESPVLLDELVASERISLTDEERRWTENSCVAVLAPLRGSSQQIGFLLLGRKAEGEDYTHHELELLRSLASQIGLSAENLLLLGDKLERQRLEEQLGVARRIQEGLLPATLHVPGCEVAARIRFCLQVAGDFYDCISLRDGRVLLAIGDVAGKGVGAALLMANVQASLRAIKNTGISLTDVASEINAIVHQNTPSNLFITLFVAIYDPLRRNLTYVNAGHNPPILRRANGEVRHLSTGGLLLGVRAIAEYQHETVSLQPGDMVLMYTDGVVEARDARGDQFGTERLEAMLPLFAPLPLREALDCLEEEVRRFTGRLDMEDDFTLLVLRVNGDGAPIELHQEAAAEVLL